MTDSLAQTSRSREGRRAARAVEALNQALAARFGNNLVTSEAVRIQHGHTLIQKLGCLKLLSPLCFMCKDSLFVPSGNH